MKNACFSPFVHIYVQFFEYLSEKMSNWACHISIMGVFLHIKQGKASVFRVFFVPLSAQFRARVLKR